MWSRRLVLAAAFAVLAGSLVKTAVASGRTLAQPADPLAAFERFIGNWQFPDSFVTANPWAADFHARTWSWGPNKAIVRLGETVHKVTPERRVFEGFAYWHPVERKVRFVGYNVQQKFLFEGSYEVLTPDRIVREYTVHYPADFEHDTFTEVTGPVRRYRGELSLVGDSMILGSTFLRVGNQWKRWPTDSAPPFRISRAR